MNRKRGAWKMPDSIKHLVDNAPPWLVPALLAMFIAIVRVIYDAKETKPKRILLESILCGLLTVIAHSVITAMGLDPEWSVAAGGTIGFMGSMAIRSIALKLLESRTK